MGADMQGRRRSIPPWRVCPCFRRGAVRARGCGAACALQPKDDGVYSGWPIPITERYQEVLTVIRALPRRVPSSTFHTQLPINGVAAECGEAAKEGTWTERRAGALSRARWSALTGDGPGCTATCAASLRYYARRARDYAPIMWAWRSSCRRGTEPLPSSGA